jgi:hypothetical protein
MIQRTRLAATAFPLFGLSATCAYSAHTYNQGTKWEVPITGYDPREHPRGHHVKFHYD